MLSVVLALLVIAPTFFSVLQLTEGEFKGIYPLRNDDEEHYLTMIREVVDGNYTMGNPYLSIGKNNPYTQPFLADIYYATFVYLFGISIPFAAVLNDGILIAVGSFLLYLFFFRVYVSRSLSLLATLFFFLMFLFQFNRPVNPQLSFIFLILGLHLIWTIVDRKHTIVKLIGYNVLFSIVFGILFYIYPFYWMTLGVIYAGLTLTSFVLDPDLKYWLISWFAWIVPLFLWCIPFILNLLLLSENQNLVETFARNGYIYTRIPSGFLSIAPLFFSVFSLLLLYRLVPRLDWTHGKQFFLAMVMVVGGIILHWQNVVTGVALQFTSHLFLITGLFVTFIGASAFWYMHRSPFRLFSLLLSFVVLTPLFFVGYVQRHTTAVAIHNIFFPQNISTEQRRGPVLSWLSQQPRGVVYSFDTEYNRLMTVYTHHDVVFALHAGIFLLPDSEQEERWVAQHFFDSIDVSTVYGNREIWIDKYLATYQTKEVRRKILETVTQKAYPPNQLMDPNIVKKIMQLHTISQKDGFEATLKKYEVMYVVLDTHNKKYKSVEKTLSGFSFLTLKYAYDGTNVYLVKY